MKQLSIFLVVQLICSISCFSQVDYKQAYDVALHEYTSFEEQHGHFFQTKNVNLHYYTWGKKTGKPLVWLHGTNSNGTEILDFVDTLVSNGYYVIAVDYYGHGLTPIPEKEVSIYHVADDVNALLHQLKIKQVIIGGWSRGGMIASAFYETYPEKVKGIILEDGGGASFLQPRQQLDEELLKKRYEQMYSASEDTTFSSQFEAFQFYYDPNFADSQFWWLALIRQSKKGGWCLNPDLKEWLGQTTAEDGLRNIYKTMTAPLFEASSLLFVPKIAYRNLTVPVLIFDPQGDDKDGFFALSDQYEELQKMHPGYVTLLHYPDTGHAVHYEQSERFKTDILHFLQKIH